MSDSKTILIVEDDADISMIEEAYLESAGYRTRIIEDGTLVNAAIQEEQFDLILLDLMLPGKSGYEICREIRDKTDIPILMVTARTESVDKIRGLDWEQMITSQSLLTQRSLWRGSMQT